MHGRHVYSSGAIRTEASDFVQSGTDASRDFNNASKPPFSHWHCNSSLAQDLMGRVCNFSRARTSSIKHQSMFDAKWNRLPN